MTYRYQQVHVRLPELVAGFEGLGRRVDQAQVHNVHAGTLEAILDDLQITFEPLLQALELGPIRRQTNAEQTNFYGSHAGGFNDGTAFEASGARPSVRLNGTGCRRDVADSLTAGYGATAGHDYPTLLSQRLGIPIINQGHSGDTTADGLRRLGQVLPLRPSVVLLCLGGNDCLPPRDVPVDVMISNLGRIIDQLQQQGAFVVLIGVHSPSVLDKNKKHFRQLARDKRTFYVPDIFKGIFLKPIYMSDALHPNDAGYRAIAERLEKELRPLLPSLLPSNAARTATFVARRCTRLTFRRCAQTQRWREIETRVQISVDRRDARPRRCWSIAPGCRAR